MTQRRSRSSGRQSRHTTSQTKASKSELYPGNFEDAVGDIQSYIGNSFPLIFIDPTGWTGYPFDKIKPLFVRPKCEVLINFMYSFVQKFVHSNDESTITSLEPILGGPGWRTRLDPNLDRGPATEKLFRETLKAVGNFEFVVSTKIDKETTDRPHFFIAYGTKGNYHLYKPLTICCNGFIPMEPRDDYHSEPSLSGRNQSSRMA